MTAPDLDELARLHSEYMQEARGEEESDLRYVLTNRLINAFPALLATARRERRMREALELLQRANRDDGLTEVARRTGMSMVLDAALAEEGQDG